MSIPDRSCWLSITYALTIFLSAFLLFQVQPLVSKYILPWFGGSPAVWTTCMLFFQALLFAGYAYAHLSREWLSPRRQALLHIVVLIVALGLLRVLPDASWEPQAYSEPVWRILMLLTISVGLPYFVLSTSGPLMQAWFVRSYVGRTPYRLYALSNVGSLLALLSYPILFERWFDIPHQAAYWSWGFVAFACLSGLAAVNVWLISDNAGANSEIEGESAAVAPVDFCPHELGFRSTWQQCALWIGLPTLASVILLATTNHICTDVAVMPFLWVLPLACYLLTFIIAFDHPRWYRPTLIAVLTLLAIYGVAMVSRRGPGQIYLYDCATTGRLAAILARGLGYGGISEEGVASEGPHFHVNFLAYLSLNILALFGACMLCHGELARQRPHSRFLTKYYLMIAAGGALGGVLVTLIAPHLFETFFEWELTIFVVCIGSLAITLYALVRWITSGESQAATNLPFRVGPSIVLVILLLPAGLILIDLAEYLAHSDAGVLHRERNFFGTLGVRERDADKPEIHDLILQHGIIQHGSQFTHENRRRKPTTYYGPKSGVGLALNYYQGKLSDGGLRIAAIGLGVGTLAAYTRMEDSISFYEINPAVREITESGHWFTYLKDCQERGATYDIRMGDARLMLARELREGNRKRCHILALDAFSGDAIPAHLLTEEAFKIYVQQLTSAETGDEEGAIAVHVTNRYLELEPVVRGAAERLGLGMTRIWSGPSLDDVICSAEWIILSRNQTLLAQLAPAAMQVSEHLKPSILWTDSRSNLFDVLK